jgi:hypothetical protein
MVSVLIKTVKKCTSWKTCDMTFFNNGQLCSAYASICHKGHDLIFEYCDEDGDEFYCDCSKNGKWKIFDYK